MAGLSEGLKKGPFSTLYVEERALSYPLTQSLIKRYEAPLILIKHYKDVFNRSNQHFMRQKQQPSLILAVKEPPFLYKGPSVCQDFGHPHFYYTSFMLNCLFDCSYCYLQGMYATGNAVAFVNTEDFKKAVGELGEREAPYVAFSYDTDLMGFNGVINYCDQVYESLRDHPGIFGELRTKSGSTAFYKNHEPLDNLILAFTLAPEGVISAFERGTPSLEARLKALREAQERGFKVRICLDPVFIGPQVDALYEPFFHQVFSNIDPERLCDVGYGFFRMSQAFYKRIRKVREDSLLYYGNYEVENGVVTYPSSLRRDTEERHRALLARYIKGEKVFSL